MRWVLQPATQHHHSPLASPVLQPSAADDVASSLRLVLLQAVCSHQEARLLLIMECRRNTQLDVCIQYPAVDGRVTATCGQRLSD